MPLRFMLPLTTMLLMLSACATARPRLAYQLDAGPDPSQIAMIQAGDYSMLTARTAPHGDPNAKIICESPSPDWATAYATAWGLSGSGGVTGGPSASLSANASNTESLVQLAGRTAGVVALRDGLYQACQAYANGQLGRAAYSMILSQYGNVLGAVIGAGSSASSTPAAAATGSAAPVSVAVAVPAAAAASSAAPTPGGSGGAGSVLLPTAVLQMQQEHIQALVVACLNAYDPTLGPAGAAPADQDVLSKATCNALLTSIAGQARVLLSPAVQSPPSDQTKAACPPNGQPIAISVMKVQTALHAAGVYAGRANGKSNAQTTAAIGAFQAANGLCISGSVDAATAKKLGIASS